MVRLQNRCVFIIIDKITTPTTTTIGDGLLTTKDLSLSTLKRLNTCVGDGADGDAVITKDEWLTVLVRFDDVEKEVEDDEEKEELATKPSMKRKINAVALAIFEALDSDGDEELTARDSILPSTLSALELATSTLQVNSCVTKEEFEVLFDLTKFRKWRILKDCYVLSLEDYHGLTVDEVMECHMLLEKALPSALP